MYSIEVVKPRMRPCVPGDFESGGRLTQHDVAIPNILTKNGTFSARLDFKIAAAASCFMNRAHINASLPICAHRRGLLVGNRAQRPVEIPIAEGACAPCPASTLSLQR
eukprot:6605325-Prymnesium_polylepis.1